MDQVLSSVSTCEIATEELMASAVRPKISAYIVITTQYIFDMLQNVHLIVPV